jgi:hypothetical protein
MLQESLDHVIPTLPRRTVQRSVHVGVGKVQLGTVLEELPDDGQEACLGGGMERRDGEQVLRRFVESGT